MKEGKAFCSLSVPFSFPEFTFFSWRERTVFAAKKSHDFADLESSFFHQISLWIGGATHSSFPECFCSRSLQLWIGEAAHSGGNLSHCGGNPLAWGHFVPPHRSPVYALTVFCVYFQLYRYANVSHVFLMFPKTVSLLWHIFLWNGNYNLEYEVSWPTSACGATRYQGNAPSGRAPTAESFLFWTEFENSRRSNRHLSVRSLMTKNT